MRLLESGQMACRTKHDDPKDSESAIDINKGLGFRDSFL